MIAEAELLDHAYCFSCDLNHEIDLSNQINDADDLVVDTEEDMIDDSIVADHAPIVHYPRATSPQPTVGLLGGARGDDSRASLWIICLVLGRY